MQRRTDNFGKFFEKKKKNGAIKEAFKQEKRAAKKERKEAIERHFEEKRKARAAAFAPNPPAKGRTPKTLTTKTGVVKNAPGTPPAAKRGMPKNSPVIPGKPVRSGKPAPADTAAAPAPKGTAPYAAKGITPNAAKGATAPAKGIPTPPVKGAPAKGAGNLPLNKYIAHSGLCSRRDAADLIREGKVQVNGQVVTEPGTKVIESDLVKVAGKKITMSRDFVYILLNKPKDYITTSEDPQGRKTVLDLIRHATQERVYPIGRLDRNTSGVLLLTNDGDLAQKLSHPKHEVKKIYHVTLDKPVTKADFDKIAAGVQLEDGMAFVDVIAYADARDKAQIGLEIHSGRNRIVRRIFEHLGYDVRGLDRVMYAGLTKKNVNRGKWRLLNEREVRILKYLNSSKKGH